MDRVGRFWLDLVEYKQGGIGSVKNVSFSNIQVSDVKVPIMIDQYYCDKSKCKNQTGAVAISGITYDQIIGSYSVQPIHLACSSQIPCVDVDLIDIQLKPSSESRGFQNSLCWNSYGKSQAPLLPTSIDSCLRRGGGAVRRIARSHDYVCYWFSMFPLLFLFFPLSSFPSAVFSLFFLKNVGRWWL